MISTYRRPVTSWDQLPVLLSPEQAARLLMVSIEKIRRLCRDGKLPAIKIGEEWRIDRDKLRDGGN